jgi:hypothetical protein
MGELVGIAILAFMFFVGSKIVNAAKGGYQNVLDQFEAQQQAQKARLEQLQSRVQVTGPPGSPYDRDLRTGQPVMAQARPMAARPVSPQQQGLKARPVPAAPAAKKQAAPVRPSDRGAASARREAETTRDRTRASARRHLRQLVPGNVEALRSAVVMSEVLGKPVSLRSPDEHLPS